MENNERFEPWGLLCLFSVISLAAYETDQVATATEEEGWKHFVYMTCACLSLAFGFIGALTHVVIHMKHVRGHQLMIMIIEGIISLILTVLWSVSLYFLFDPTSGMGQMYVGKSGSNVAQYQATISNANLYLASLGAILCALFVLIDICIYVGEKIKCHCSDDRNSSNSPQVTTSPKHQVHGAIKKLCLIILASGVAIVESMRYEDQVCIIEGGAEDATCKKNQWGFYIGR